MSKPLRTALGFVIVFILSIPWYWPETLIRPFLLGLPLWAFVSLAVSVVLACYTAWAIHHFWKDD